MKSAHHRIKFVSYASIFQCNQIKDFYNFDALNTCKEMRQFKKAYAYGAAATLNKKLTIKCEESDLFLRRVWIHFHALSFLKHLQITQLPQPSSH